MKYGLDKDTIEPLKEGLSIKKRYYIKSFTWVKKFRFKTEDTVTKRDELVNILNSIVNNIDVVTNICDEVIIETSVIKSLSILGYDGSEALNNLCNEHNKLL